MAASDTSFHSAGLARGFTMAMSARVLTGSPPARHEWLIVSRFGPAGAHLAISRTAIEARRGAPAPINLQPTQTAFADMLHLPVSFGGTTFLLTKQPPQSLRLAGTFLPTEGYIRLYCRGTTLRLQAEGRCTCDTALFSWRVEAVRAEWMGEFVETRAEDGG